jgi:hypothetical protein
MLIASRLLLSTIEFWQRGRRPVQSKSEPTRRMIAPAPRPSLARATRRLVAGQAP